VYRQLESLGQSACLTPVIVEARGRKEDDSLELAFRRVRDGNNALNRPLPFQVVMVPKSANSAGLQMADLMARPVGLHHLRPDQPNRAFDLIQTKLRRSPAGKIEGGALRSSPENAKGLREFPEAQRRPEFPVQLTSNQTYFPHFASLPITPTLLKSDSPPPSS